MNDVRKQGERTSSNISQQFQKVGDSFVSAGKKLTAGITAPLSALQGISVKLYDNQIQAEKRLEAALKATGEEVRSNMADFKEFASSLQEITTVGDESTLQMIQTAKSMGLTNDQAKRAAKNSIALAKAMDMNEQSAIRYAAALEQGQVTMLSRYLPGLREIEDMSERAAKAQELLSDMFGAATAEAETGLGPLRQIKNTLGDFAEEIGEIVLKRMQPFIDLLGDTVNWFKALDQQTKENIVTIAGVASAIGPLLISVGALAKLLPVLTTGFAALTGPIGLTVGAIGALSAAIVYAVDNWDAIIERVSDISWWRNAIIDMVQFFIDWNPVSMIRDAFNNLLSFFDVATIPDPFEGIKDGLDELKVETEDYEHEFGSFTDAVMNAWDSVMGMDMSGDIEQSARKMREISTIDLTKPFVDAKHASENLVASIDEVFRSIDKILGLDQGKVFDLDKMLPEPGSMQFLNEEMMKVRENLDRLAVGSEAFDKAKEKLAEMKSEMIDLRSQMVTTDDIMQNFADTLGNALEQAVIHGKELENILSNVAKQLASKALMTALKFLMPGGPSIGGASFLGTMFGNFHGGGIVAGSGEKPVMAKGGEGIFTKSQMQAMGGMMRSGGTKIDYGKMKQAFQQAFRSEAQKLGPEQMFMMAQKGKFSF